VTSCYRQVHAAHAQTVDCIFGRITASVCSYAMEYGPDDLRSIVDEPFRFTFTAHLPFLLGIPDDLGHIIVFDTPYVDPEDTARYGERATVDIRVFTLETAGVPLWPIGTHEALSRFYGYKLEGDPHTRHSEDSLVEQDQWVTLETPSALMAGDDATADPAYAFHRCLIAFNLFLEGVLVTTQDIRIRPITSYDLRPVVIIGALRPGKEWEMLTAMFMHPEALPDSLPLDDRPITEEQLNRGLHAILTEHPYITTVLWRSRAQRALRHTGDPADAIISFQIAAEGLLFDTYRMFASR
jgi:hypothetical protein